MGDIMGAKKEEQRGEEEVQRVYREVAEGEEKFGSSQKEVKEAHSVAVGGWRVGMKRAEEVVKKELRVGEMAEVPRKMMMGDTQGVRGEAELPLLCLWDRM